MRSSAPSSDCWPYIGYLILRNKLNQRFVSVDSETSYKSANALNFLAERGYQIEFTPPRNMHNEDITERMVGLVRAKDDTSIMDLQDRRPFRVHEPCISICILDHTKQQTLLNTSSHHCH